MATHSSVLAWRIPGTGSLVGCHLWGRTESDTTEATQQQQQQQHNHVYIFTVIIFADALSSLGDSDDQTILGILKLTDTLCSDMLFYI